MMCGAGSAHAAWQQYLATTDGLSNNQVLSISEAADGSMLFGTAVGSSRFDGARWTIYTDSLPDPRVNGCVEDAQGRLWFGTNRGGVSCFDGVHWTRWNVANGALPSDQVEAMLIDHAGDLWVATFGGIARYEPGANHWTTYTAATSPLVSPSAWALLEDRSNRLWIATGQGVSQLDGTRSSWTTYRQSPLGLGRDSVLALGEDDAGGVWFGTDVGAFRLLGTRWSRFVPADGLPATAVLAFARDGWGHLWIGGKDGVARFDGRTIRPDLQADHVFFGKVNALRVDRSGYVWAATEQNGLLRYDGVNWHHYFSTPSPDSLRCPAQPSPNIPNLPALPVASNCLSAMTSDAKGELWFGTDGGGTSRLEKNGRWSAVRRAGSVPVSDSITALLGDAGGNVWFGSRESGLAQLDASRLYWTPHSLATGLASDSVVSLHESPQGEVWAGTRNGASMWDGSAWTSWLRGGVAGFPARVDAFLDDDAGNLWMMTSAGLHSLDPGRGQLRQWTASDGLADDLVTAMLHTAGDALWFGTARGLSRYAAGAWTTWKTFGFAGDSVVHALAVDSLGRVWVGTDRDAAYWDGVSWRAFGELELGFSPVTGILVDDRGDPWLSGSRIVARWNGRAWRNYDNLGNGLAGVGVVASMRDSQRRLWFASSGGGASGLAEHEPDRTAPQTVFTTRPPALSVSRTATFAFGAAYGEAADLEFSSAWDGEPWTPWTPISDRSFTGVADGTHTLSVRARDWVGNVDSTAATFRLEVDATPPAAVLTSPASGQPVRGTVAIVGSAADTRFRAFTLQARREGVPTWTDPRVLTLATASRPVNDDTLATWNTAGLAEGNWDLRLAVEDTLGLVGPTQVRAIVDNEPPFTDVTSPVRIVAGDGGQVFTTGAEVRLYFPPGAFDADAVVRVDSLAAGALPDTLPGGEVRAGAAWALSWSGGSLVKPATLELRPPSGTASPGAWREETPGEWRHVGGTLANGVLSLAIPGPARYAVYAGTPLAGAGRRLSVLSFTPRVFAPSGGYASADVAIAFSLSQPGAVTVKVYNRAGRLVRTVADHLAAGPGQTLVRWDGRDRDGRVAEPGIYLVNVEALGESRTQTLGVVR